jgi:hypothetical protein
VVKVFNWDRSSQNTEIGKIEIPSDQVWDFLHQGFYEEVVVEYPIIGDDKRHVVGNDREVACICFKVRILPGIKPRWGVQIITRHLNRQKSL